MTDSAFSVRIFCSSDDKSLSVILLSIFPPCYDKSMLLDSRVNAGKGTACLSKYRNDF